MKVRVMHIDRLPYSWGGTRCGGYVREGHSSTKPEHFTFYVCKNGLYTPCETCANLAAIEILGTLDI